MADPSAVTLLELARRFPDEEAAARWFESVFWPDGVKWCPHCGGDDTHACKHPTMPYRCRECRGYFGLRTGTIMAKSPLPLLKWLYAIYLDVTAPKGISSVQLGKDIGVCQKTAWFMQQRIREGFETSAMRDQLRGTVEVDETFVGGKQPTRHRRDRRRYSAADNWGKTIVVGAIERNGRAVAVPIRSNDALTLTHFVRLHVRFASRVFTDDHGGYEDLMESYRHRTVKHSRGEYVRPGTDIHTNTIESFWSGFKRAFKGTYHKLSPKHLHRYLNEFTWRHNVRHLGTLDRMKEAAERMVCRRLRYRDLIMPNGLPSGANPQTAWLP
ncbi:MAG: IS1595 family transposase [Acidobacteria bacterium]|nr:IS1595 family transposase [Acidobacteriota bacterium]